MFNIYCHQSLLVVRCKSKNNNISLYSSEWVRQRCPLTVVGCGILLLPLIAQLKSEFPKVTSLWYANDGATAGTLKHVFYFKQLCEVGSDYGFCMRKIKVWRLLGVRIVKRLSFKVCLERNRMWF